MTSTLSAGELAAAARSDRNRAVDFYRAAAMLFVALGHWLVIHVGVDADGGVVGGNAIEYSGWIQASTWIFQVMPLFFAIGGFSSAMSLDSHTLKDGTRSDWVAARLGRMLAPTGVLAAIWLVVIAAGSALGFSGPVIAAASASAIPLWFLANYTIDIAVAPYLLPRFRANPMRVTAILVGTFTTFELLRLAEAPVRDEINWVIGWLSFQVLGFAWKDGLLPTGRRLIGLAASVTAVAVAMVAFGPWPVTMVHFPGVENSPTHPPSLAFLAFGISYSLWAIAAAPAISSWLTRSRTAWTAVVTANPMAMSVYLWHFTAAIASAAILYGFGALPTADVSSGAWFVQKLPLIGLALVLLVPIVAAVSRYERRALLAPKRPWPYSATSMILTAALVSASVKLWVLGPSGVIAGCVGVLAGLAILNHGGSTRLERLGRTSLGWNDQPD